MIVLPSLALGWFLLLILQSAAFTWVSRARNSGSYAYHAVASFFSNITWFGTQLLLIDFLVMKDRTREELLGTGLVYVTGMVCGSVLMHWVASRWLESGKRKVGA